VARRGRPSRVRHAALRTRNRRVKQEDLLLIERCKKGDQAAYSQLLRKYQNSVYNLCRKMVRNPEEARDLTQEAFVKTFATLDRFNPVYAFSSWLYKITANLCIDHIRKQRMKMLSIDEPFEGDEGAISRQLEDRKQRPDEMSENSEVRSAIQAAIDRLPEHYRVILIMRHQEQLSYEEIAQALDIPLGTVKARIHRAREGLKALLQAHQP
jgi:RNA polymerase sigma-70 factor (ECF subfamily)